MPKPITKLRNIAIDKDVYIFGRGFSYSWFEWESMPKDAITVAVNARNMKRVYDYNVFMDKSYYPFASILHKQISPKSIHCPFTIYEFDGGSFNGSGVAALWIVQFIMQAKHIHLIGYDMCDYIVGDEPITYGDTCEYIKDYDYENIRKSFKGFQWNRERITNHCPHSLLDLS